MNAVTGPTFKADGGSFNDPGDAYAAIAGTVISFYHMPSKIAVYFKAFITNFNETFASDWAQESVYGRADPIYMFKQTRRSINLAFKIPASSKKEAYENLARVQALAQFLYPTYVRADEAQTITQSPLIRLKVMNLLRNTAEGATASDADGYSAVCGGSVAANGILGVIESVAIDHSLAAPDGVVEMGGSTILSKIIEVNLNFSVIHEHSLGWDEEGKFQTPAFPYGAAAGETVTRAEEAALNGDGKSPNEQAAIASVIGVPPVGSSSPR